MVMIALMAAGNKNTIIVSGSQTIYVGTRYNLIDPPGFYTILTTTGLNSRGDQQLEKPGSQHEQGQ